MQKNIRIFYIFLILSLSIVSCAPVISKEYSDAAVKDVPFNQLIKDRGAYLNKMFIFGGLIAETKITGKGSEIEVVQSPIDRSGTIINSDISEGRFIIITSKHLDPLIYRKGRAITFAGILTGSQKRMLGEIEYDYPVFDAKEIYLFKEERYYSYPYMYPYGYDPYSYPSFYYPYDPFWPRPYAPNWPRPDVFYP